MKKQNIHVVPHPRGWAPKREGAERATSVYPTQKEAEKAAREIARKDGVELIIHGQDGKIRERDSYGKDPCPPKDQE